MDVHDYVKDPNMGKLEELKTFISERLQTVVIEIFGAVDKTVTEYEEQACRLKEENSRHCSILELLIKANKLPRKEAGPDPTVSVPSHVEGTFNSYTDFIDFASGDNCRYCKEPVEAIKSHLTKKHYSAAVYFTDNGIGRFIVACACKAMTQKRSHWHCAYCNRILTRRNNFLQHMSKVHDNPIQRTNLGAGNVPFSPSEVDVAPVLGAGCQQEFVFRDQKFALLPVKIEEAHYSGQQSLEGLGDQNSALNFLYMDTSAHQFNEIEVPSSDLKPLSSKTMTMMKKKKHRKKLTLNGKQKRAIQTDPRVYTCQVCGKTFHYIYTLKSHVWTHLGSKSLCGICGRQIKDAESLVRHLESHTARKKCGMCGKQFSSAARLKNHWRFHRRNPPNVMSLS